jgi:hypothetical protein
MRQALSGTIFMKHPLCPTFVSALVNPVFLWCPCSSFCFPCFYFQLLVFVLSISASITHPPLHSYIFKSRKVLAVIQETKDQRKKEIIIVFWDMGIFVTVNMIVMFNSMLKPKGISNFYTSQSLYTFYMISNKLITLVFNKALTIICIDILWLFICTNHTQWYSQIVQSW